MKGMALLKKIVALVLVCHGALIGYLSWTTVVEIKPPQRVKMLVVQTVSLKEEKVAEVVKEELIASAAPVKKEELPPPPPPPPPPPAPKKKAEPKKLAKKEKPRPIKQKATPPPRPVKKERDATLDALLADAEKSMKALDKKQEKRAPAGKTPIAIPKKIETLEIDAGGKVLTETEVTYRDALAMELKRFLRLPEMGEVKVELTLARSGLVEKVAVIGAKSVMNRTYIESTLPTLKFSQFSKNFTGHAHYTFVITLTNQ